MKILREETFGAVVFDTYTLKHKFVNQPENVNAERVIPLTTLPPRQDILSAPIRVFFEITRLCNLECAHCFVSASPQADYGLETKKILSILDQLHNFRVISICFTGGEPTTRRDWYEIVSYAKHKGFAISINTNGVFSNPTKTIERFSELLPEKIIVSLDGMADAHDAIRGKGTFQKTAQALRMMSIAGLHVQLNTVICQRNASDIPTMVAYASEIADGINFFSIRPVGRATNLENPILSFEENYKLAVIISNLREEYPKLDIRHFGQYLTKPDESSAHSDVGKMLKLAGPYPYGNTTLSIAADGTIWPHGFSRYQTEALRLGQLPKDSLPDIWYYSANLNKLRSWFHLLKQRCNRCPEYMTRCIGLNFETEVARIINDIEFDPHCISQEPIPEFVFSHPIPSQDTYFKPKLTNGYL